MATPAPDYSDIYKQAGAATNLDPDLLHAMGDVESHQDRFAVSPAGAEGVMQLMPGTADEVGVRDSFAPADNIPGGARYLRKMFDHPRIAGDPYRAISAYNAGPNGDFSNPETTDYRQKVMDRWTARRQARWDQEAANKTPSVGAFDDLIPSQKTTQADSPGAFDDLIPPKKLPVAKQDEGSPAAKPPEPEVHVPGQGMVGAAYDSMRKGFVKGVASTIEGGGDIYRRVTGDDPAAPNAAITAGQKLAKRAEDSYPIDPSNQGFTTNVAEGIGGMAPLLAAPVLGAAGATVATIAAVGAQSYAATHTEALAKGATPNEADQAAAISAPVQAAIMALPIGRVLHGTPEIATGLWKTIEGMTKRGVEFGSFNALAQFADNFVAQQTYEPKRDLTQGLPEKVAEGIVTGGLLHGPLKALEKPAVRPPSPEVTPPVDNPVQPPTGAPPADSTMPMPNLPENYMPGGEAPAPAPSPESPTPPPTPEAPPSPAPAPEATPVPATGDDARAVLDNIIEGKPAETPPEAPPPPPVPEATPPPVESTPQIPPENSTPPPPAPTQESTPAPAAVPDPAQDVRNPYQMLRPDQLAIDPGRFQYKDSGEHGVTGVLKGVSTWEPHLADPITVWQDNAGKMFVVNGHQRFDLARRAEAAGQQDVMMTAKVFREADGNTPEFMRALGGFQNIAQGSGTPIDAAKVLRAIGNLPENLRGRLPQLSTTGAIMRDAAGLTKLGDEAFGAIVNDVIPPSWGAHVGALITDPAQQMAAIRVLHDADPANADQARMIVLDVKNTEFEKQQASKQGVMFDMADDQTSMVPQRAKVLDYVTKLLRKNVSQYRAAVRGESTLTSVEGTKINVEGTQQAKGENEQLIDKLEKNAFTRGPVSDALTAAARQLHGGDAIGPVGAQFLAKVREIDTSRSAEGLQHGADPERAEPAGETESEPPVEGQGGFFSPEGQLNAPSRIPLYSAVTRAVDGIKQARGNGQQMLAAITGTRGVKPEEIKYLGLEDWLRGQKSVTKEQIQDYVRANTLDVQEIHKGGESEPDHGSNGWSSVGGGDRTKWGQYTLPGGSNYREMLITLPPDAAATAKARAAEIAKLDAQLQDINRQRSGPFMSAGLTAELDRQARNLAAEMDAVRKQGDSATYRSSHWSEPNVLAHIRMNERTTPDGKKTLLVEEAQSDWHQEGRKKGYNGQITDLPPGWKIVEYPGNQFGVEDPTGRHLTSYGHPTREAALTDALHHINAMAVPDAPFKTSWPSLIMKRVLKYAAENGFDRVAWAPGQVHADRYSLAHQVARLHYIDQGDGTYMVGPEGHDGREIPINQGQPIPKDKIADYVGQEVAQKIINGHGKGEGSVKTLDTNDLKVGGEGMKGFYDKILPTETAKMIKPFGGKVGQSEVHTGKPDRETLKPDAQAVADHDAEWKKITDEIHRNEAKNMPWQDKADLNSALYAKLDAIHAKMIDETHARSQTTQGVHSFEITPEIRKAVADQGLPLFEPKRGKINARGQADMFADRTTPRPDITPPKPVGKQIEMFPSNDAAIQAQKARDARGLTPDVEQKKADDGLFADRAEGQGKLEATDKLTDKLTDKPGLTDKPEPATFRIARSQLGTFHVKESARGEARGVDVTYEVQQRPDVPGQVTATRFVIDRGEQTGHEYLTVVDHATGDVIHAGTNNRPGFVGIDVKTLRGRPDDGVSVHHNHPGGMGLSPQDMMLLYAPGLGHVVAHADGDVLIAAAGPRVRGRRDYNNPVVAMVIKGQHDINNGIVKKMFQDLVDVLHTRGRDPAFDTALMDRSNRSYHDIVARLMHADGVISYTSTRPIDAYVRGEVEARLTRAGYTPIEIAGALKVHTVDEAMASLPQPKGPREDGIRHDGRSAGTVRPGSGTAGVFEGQRGRGQPIDARGAGNRAPAAERTPVRSKATGAPDRLTAPPANPVGPPQNRLERFLSAARDLYENARSKTNEEMTKLISPLAGGSQRAMAIAQQFANALRGVNYQFKLVDDHLRKTFKPADRLAMGRAMDETSVLESQIRQMRDANAANAQGTLGATSPPAMTQAQLAAAEATLRQQWTAAGKGIETLPADQRAAVQRLATLGDQVWERMRSRGLVDDNARGLPFYFARIVLQKDALGNTIKAKAPTGTGSDIFGIGSNLSTAGPMHRKYLTPEETLANAKLALGDPNAFMLQDIRAVPAALARNERSIAGKDLIDAIKRIGVATGNNTVLHGQIPNGVNPGDYFTINHPSFQQYTGSGFQSIHVAKEFQGPLEAVLTLPSGGVYNAVMKAKGASMSAIMWSPLMHLNVELGRALPLLKGKMLTAKFWQDGGRLSRDQGYMQRATEDGLAPIGQGWRGDAATLFDESDLNRPPAGKIGQALQGLHDFHQKFLWDTVFKLQVGIYDSMRTQMMQKGYDEKTAGIMAAHWSNRYAGALPAENLRKGANQMANLLLFSRSFTLGNLGVMKDMLNGMPRQTAALIQQHAGTDVANRAVSEARRKAIGAVILDVGIAVIANQLVQEGAAAIQRAGAMGVGPAVQSVFDDWLTQAKGALTKTATSYNPMDMLGVLPTFNNEPQKTDRALLGKDEQGRGIYARLALGKVGEEFMKWPTTPGQMLFNKMSPWARPLFEDLNGADSLGRKVYDPNGSLLSKLGASITHVMTSLGPVDQAKGAAQLVKQMTGNGDKAADPWVQGFRTFLPATGLGTLSSGFPGGPEAGEIYHEKQSLQFQQQQAMPEARKLYQNGDSAGAMKRLIDAGMLPRDAARAMRYMNQSMATAAQQRWAAKHETPDQQHGRSLINTGRPLTPAAP